MFMLIFFSFLLMIRTVHCQIIDKSTSDAIFVTFICGVHTMGDRKALGPRLLDIAYFVTGPWILAGDFNVVYS